MSSTFQYLRMFTINVGTCNNNIFLNHFVMDKLWLFHVINVTIFNISSNYFLSINIFERPEKNCFSCSFRLYVTFPFFVDYYVVCL